MNPKRNILLISDRGAERDALALGLGDLGFHPRVASTFELAFAVAQEPPDLLVIEAVSLRSDDVAQTLQEGSVECPILAIADRPSPELRALAVECGAVGYLDKPSSPQALAVMIGRFLSPPSQPPREWQRERVDFVSIARRSTRDQFVTAWSCPFLVSGSSLIAQFDRKATADILDPDVLQAIQDAVEDKVATKHSSRGHADTPSRSGALALAIRGERPDTADRVVVGRALDVDVFIDHATISKHHACFLRSPDGMRLSDTGSRNGTWVGGKLLVPKGPPSALVESGDAIRFGELEFTFLRASAAWDLLRVNVR